MTRTLTLKNCFQGNSTIVENDFIDHHMAKANGEYVKIYLLLLRHLNDASSSLSISGLADCLECTEKDVLRAFKHWSKEGLLQIHYDESGNICGLAIGKSASGQEATAAPVTPITLRPATFEVPTVPTTPVAPALPKNSAVSASPKQSSKDDGANLRQLYFVAEQYMGKILSSNEIKKINFFYDELQFSTDLIEYLIEYCVENGHRSFRYIEATALKWSEAGIESVEEAKNSSELYTKSNFAILNAFGITGRCPAKAELAFIKKWTDEYGFTLDIILEACNRTINNTHKPDFKYTDSILSSWLSNNVHHLSDVARLDQAYMKDKETKKRGTTKVPTATRFNNFEGRSYDMNSLEQQLLNTH